MGIKEEFLRLLREDEEFRYMVAGYIGLSEILKRMDDNIKESRELQKQVTRLQEQVVEHSKAIRELQQQVREHTGVIRGLQEQVSYNTKIIAEHTEAIRRL